jgi:hypothetical protein
MEIKHKDNSEDCTKEQLKAFDEMYTVNPLSFLDSVLHRDAGVMMSSHSVHDAETR